MTFQVEIVPDAAQDVQDIVAWIRRRSPEGARAWGRAWLSAIEQLEKYPQNCNAAPEARLHRPDVKQLIFKTRRGKPYRILLTIRESTVFVLHVRGPGQNVLNPSEIRSPPV